jgi:hypothetical protein
MGKDGLAIIGLLYDVLYGRDKRIVWSREHVYRNSGLRDIPDEEFCSHKLFIEHEVPRDFVRKMRKALSDWYLDFLEEKLDPTDPPVIT